MLLTFMNLACITPQHTHRMGHLVDCHEYAIHKVGLVTLETLNRTHYKLTKIQYIPGLKNLKSVRSRTPRSWLITPR